MNTWWVYDFEWTEREKVQYLAAAQTWRSVDGKWGRLHGNGEGPAAATPLICLHQLSGVSAGQQATHYYFVETDVSDQNEAEFNDWYNEEHLPGLSRVPGTISARRFLRLVGAPRYLACYELTNAATLDHPAWLAVRHTAWSDRIRPLFQNTRRTMYSLAKCPDSTNLDAIKCKGSSGLPLNHR